MIKKIEKKVGVCKVKPKKFTIKFFCDIFERCYMLLLQKNYSEGKYLVAKSIEKFHDSLTGVTGCMNKHKSWFKIGKAYPY